MAWQGLPDALLDLLAVLPRAEFPLCAVLLNGIELKPSEERDTKNGVRRHHASGSA